MCLGCQGLHGGALSTDAALEVFIHHRDHSSLHCEARLVNGVQARDLDQYIMRLGKSLGQIYTNRRITTDAK